MPNSLEQQMGHERPTNQRTRNQGSNQQHKQRSKHAGKQGRKEASVYNKLPLTTIYSQLLASVSLWLGTVAGLRAAPLDYENHIFLTSSYQL